jgi:DNA-binding transcriptional LysR family regulator
LEKHIGVLLVRRGVRGLTLTEAGKGYLQSCRRALRILMDGRDFLSKKRLNPSGLIKIVCPIMMARNILAPLLNEFLNRYADLRVEIEAYASNWDQEPRADVDVFFKIRMPNDSLRRVRPYPGVNRSLFASPSYIKTFGDPSHPDDLSTRCCIGWSPWKLTRNGRVLTPDISFRARTDDAEVSCKLAVGGIGIAVMPLYMAIWPDARTSSPGVTSVEARACRALRVVFRTSQSESEGAGVARFPR